eukprot:9444417-Pyramimonas_sp.AAC.1
MRLLPDSLRWTADEDKLARRAPLAPLLVLGAKRQGCDATVARRSCASPNFCFDSSCAAVNRTPVPTWAGQTSWMSPVSCMFG